MKEESKAGIVVAATWALRRHMSNASKLSKHQVRNLQNRIKLYSTNDPHYSLRSNIKAKVKSNKKEKQTRVFRPFQSHQEPLDDKGAVRDMLARLLESTSEIIFRFRLEKEIRKSEGVWQYRDRLGWDYTVCVNSDVISTRPTGERVYISNPFREAIFLLHIICLFIIR